MVELKVKPWQQLCSGCYLLAKALLLVHASQDMLKSPAYQVLLVVQEKVVVAMVTGHLELALGSAVQLKAKPRKKGNITLAGWDSEYSTT
jgi:hypothetical protein